MPPSVCVDNVVIHIVNMLILHIPHQRLRKSHYTDEMIVSMPLLTFLRTAEQGMLVVLIRPCRDGEA